MEHELLALARLAGPWSSAVSSVALGARVVDTMVRRPPWRRPGESGDAPLEHLRWLRGDAFWDLGVLPCAEPLPHTPCVLLVPPMSGHHPTLLRDQVLDMHPHAHIAVIGWKPPCDVPLAMGCWGVERQIASIQAAVLLARTQWPGKPIHGVAVCQPVPELLVAAADGVRVGDRLFDTLTLMGGPVDVGANPTDVGRLGAAMPLHHARWVLCRPLWSGLGVGRWVYPGSTQLVAFMSMHPQRHAEAFRGRIEEAPWAGGASTPFTRFYGEYLAVVDLPAEFYLDTLRRVFQDRDLIHRRFRYNGRTIDTDLLADTPLAVVEGERDDICAPGQCAAALDLIPAGADRLLHVAQGVGHYGVFSGRVWREQTLPKLLGFWSAASGLDRAG